MKLTKVTVLIFSVFVAGCQEPARPVSQQRTENGMETTLLAVVDGCRIWKVRGWGETVFFANCGPGPARTQWTVQSGKTQSARFMLPAEHPAALARDTEQSR